MRSSPSPLQNELEGKDERIDPIDPVTTVYIPEDIMVSHKRPRWEQHTLKDAKGNQAPHGTFQE